MGVRYKPRMQTFLPYPEFDKSMRCLDPKRLGNQVYRECLTLVRGGWLNHPVSKMWRGYEFAMCKYALEGLRELTHRGRDYWHHYATYLNLLLVLPDTGIPPWLGDDRVHSSHRAALLYKDPEWYGQFGWSEKPAKPDENGKLPYFWPV